MKISRVSRSPSLLLFRLLYFLRIRSFYAVNSRDARFASLHRSFPCSIQYLLIFLFSRVTFETEFLQTRPHGVHFPVFYLSLCIAETFSSFGSRFVFFWSLECLFLVVSFLSPLANADVEECLVSSEVHFSLLSH
jgi:hypothetical protein